MPVHHKISEKEKKELFDKLNISEIHLPKIKVDDPAISKLNAKVNDVIKITRSSPTATVAFYYRSVINV